MTRAQLATLIRDAVLPELDRIAENVALRIVQARAPRKDRMRPVAVAPSADVMEKARVALERLGVKS